MDAGVVLKNESLEARVLFYGATLRALAYKGRSMVLGYPTELEYRKHGGYVGATVGRYSNRIADGRFTLNGVEYDVGCNERGRGHLHGGRVGMDKRIFTPLELGRDKVTLGIALFDGEEGYPGNMDVRVTYALRGSALEITYDADTDADTVFAPTNHSYFNLGGSLLDHELTIDAEMFLPVDEKLIPLERPEYVYGTPFDFRMPKAIGRDIHAADLQLALCGGYDHTFVLDGKAVLHSPESGVIMVVSTDMPGLQVYSGNFLQNEGGGFGVHAGVALEAQFFPNSPNRSDFPSCVLRAGQHFHSTTKYSFDG